MLKKTDILSNAVTLAVTGTKIRILSDILIFLFHRKVKPEFLCAVDRKLAKLKEEFLLCEKKHLTALSLLDI